MLNIWPLEKGKKKKKVQAKGGCEANSESCLGVQDDLSPRVGACMDGTSGSMEPSCCRGSRVERQQLG